MASRPSPQPWRRFVTPIALAIVSLVVAVALWVAVTEEENPNRIDFFGGAIEVQAVNVPEGLAVASISDVSGAGGAALVSIRISAPEQDFERLSASDFRAEVDLSGVRQNQSEQRVLVRYVGSREVSIVDVTPQAVRVVLEPVVSKVVTVETNLAGVTPQGYSLGSIEANPLTVTVTGAESLVGLVATVQADVNLTGLRATIRQQYPLVPRDERGADVRNVHLDPDRAELLVGILQQEVTLALTVLPLVQGAVAEGYNLASITVDPPAIAVTGALEALQALPYISTEPIDLSGLRADTTRSILLRLPAGLRSPRDSVSVVIRVVPALGEATITVAPRIVGLAEGLSATIQTSAVALRLSGEQPALDALKSGDVTVSADVSGLGPGIHVLPASVSAPGGITVTSVDPAQIVVVIR